MSDVELSSETTTTAKRGRGRPKKDATQSNGGIDTIKNGTNAPKETKKRAPKDRDTAPPAKRSRGRPKAKTSKAVVKKGGKRGRPKKTESVEEEAAPLDDEASASAQEEEEEEED